MEENPGTGDLNCPFCVKIQERSVKSEGPYVVSFVPLNPATPGDMLFVPRVHVPDAGTMPRLTAEVMYHACMYAAQQGKDFNIITSAGMDASQTVFHLHIHYVPRTKDDGLTLPWTGQHG
jgi:histidine triad (HIT) family protein